MAFPDPIQAYFDADRRGDAAAFVAAFVPDALVRDEGAAHRGHEAITAWWRDAKRKYDHCAEPLDITPAGDYMRVRATVSGNFPGSPATLTYRFRLADDRIAELEIGA